jgi:hypothetical protein
MNCGVLSACATVHCPSGAPIPFAAAGVEGCGGCRTRNEAGIKSANATMPIASIAVRQS